MSRPLVTWHWARQTERRRPSGDCGQRITRAGATRGRMISEAGRDRGTEARMTASYLCLFGLAPGDMEEEEEGGRQGERVDVRYFSSHCVYSGSTWSIYALLPGRVCAGIWTLMAHREGRRDAWKQLVGPNSFESPAGGPNWLSPLLLVLLCSGGGRRGILSITCIPYLGRVNTSKPWRSYRDNPHVSQGQMGNPGHPGHRSGLSLKPGWACGREG